jgi:hypothetical protein
VNSAQPWQKYHSKSSVTWFNIRQQLHMMNQIVFEIRVGNANSEQIYVIRVRKIAQE